MNLRQLIRPLRQQFERAGRRLLIWLVGLLFGRPEAKDALDSDCSKILVVRLDPRLGNALMTLPLIDCLHRHFPGAAIDLLAVQSLGPLLHQYPGLGRFYPYHKRRVLAASGPLRTLLRLRRDPYDLLIDAANPTDPSTTQALLVRFSGAVHTVGPAARGFASLYHHAYALSGATPEYPEAASATPKPARPASAEQPVAHEISMRLQSLDAIGLEHPTLAVPTLIPPGQPGAAVAAIVGSGARYALVNVGARLANKRLSIGAYAELADRLVVAGFAVYITYGPMEAGLARAVTSRVPGCRLAPPTSLVDLGHLFRSAQCTITCDTGPMHLAVAVGCATAGLFVSTDPRRYGYGPPHLSVDARQTGRRAGELTAQHLDDIGAWLRRLSES